MAPFAATTAAQQPLPAEIRIEPLSPDGTRYVFPRRPLGGYRWVAVVPLLFGLLGLSFVWGWFEHLAQAPLPMLLLFGAFGAMIVTSAVLVPIAISSAMVFGHSSIEVRGGQLWAIEYVGPFRWRRKRPLAEIKRLFVGSSGEISPANRGSSASPLANFAAIRIETSRGKPRLAAIGYPREWLVPLAHELAAHVRTAQPDLADPAAATEPGADVVDMVEVADDLGPVQRLNQPAGSQIVMTELPGSLAFEVPPAGIRRGTAGLFFFACVWLAFTGTFSFATVRDLVQPAGQQQDRVLIVLLLLLFWLGGIGLLLGALHMARRRAAIAVADGRCLVIQKGLRGEKKQVWEPGDLTAVQIGPSGMEVNNRPVMELQFLPHSGKKFGVLSGRDEAELEWLATRLTTALGIVPLRAGGAVAGDVDVKPPKSNIVCEELPGALAISIPRAGLGGAHAGMWFGAVLWNGFIAAVAAFILHDAAKNGNAELLFPMAVLSVFALVGMALFGAAIHMTIRRAEIAFAAGRLLVLQTGLFGKRRHEWGVEELAAIRAAASDTTVNNKRLMQLQLIPISGKTVTLLTGRDEDELAWIATLLRRSMDLPAETAQERGDADSRPKDV